MNASTLRISMAKAIKTLGLFGIMMALAGLLASGVRPASASSIVPSPSFGKVSVAAIMNPSSASVVRADVVIRNSEGTLVAKGVVSNALGSNYTTALAVGTYKVYVNATGYNEYTEVIKIAAGQTTVVKAALSTPIPTPVPTPVAVDPITPAPVPAQLGKVAVAVELGSNPDVQSQAKVVLRDDNGFIVATGITESSMFYAQLAPGSYKVSVTAPGFNDYSEAIKVEADQTTGVKAFLSPR